MVKIERIASRDNARLVYARKVRDGKDRTRIFIEGRRLVEEALRSQIHLEECFISTSFDRGEIVERLGQLGILVAEVPDRLFSSIADTNSPQGIVVIAKCPETKLSDLENRLASTTVFLVVFLKEINNPSNLGAILRTAEAAGVTGVIVSKNSADVFSPKATRASMGSCFRLPVVPNVTFDEVLDWARTRGLTITGTDLCVNKSYTSIDWQCPRLLIFGSEAHGLDEFESQSIDEKIVIPMENGVDSLNLAVSAGVILFEAKRQRT